MANDSSPGVLTEYVAIATGVAAPALTTPLPTTVDDARALAITLGTRAPLPGQGSTASLFALLATLGAHDLGVARVIEPHLDAVAILTQAGQAELVDSRSWGVFAAEGGEPLRLSATGTLTGTKPWCSLAATLDSALVTATDDDGVRRLVAVDLGSPGIAVLPGTWHARGLAEIASGPVRFEDVEATPIGEPGWYLDRPGFSWGGIGVAACWHGGAVGLARTVFSAAAAKPSDPYLVMHLGAIDEAIESSRRALAEAADLIDSGDAVGSDGSILAKRVRATVARTCELVLERAGHALGPAPLALDEQHAKRAADLTVYVRQHHAERDDASLGAKLLSAGTAPW